MTDMPSRPCLAWSWAAAIVLVLVGSWFASWFFYASTIDKRIELAKLQLRLQAERVAHDERMNALRHDANLAEHVTMKQFVESNRGQIDSLRHDVDALRDTVAETRVKQP